VEKVKEFYTDTYCLNTLRDLDLNVLHCMSRKFEFQIEGKILFYEGEMAFG
jgi:hypothetical protein